MAILVPIQFFGILLFITGLMLLNFCDKWERDNRSVMKQARYLSRYGRRKEDYKATQPFLWRGTLMTLAGCGTSLTGFLLFVMNIP